MRTDGGAARTTRSEARLPRLRLLVCALAQGMLWGAVLGVAVLTVISLLSWLSAVMFAPVAATVGAVIGGVDGLLAGVVLALSLSVVRGQPAAARVVAAAAAGGPPLVLAIPQVLGPWPWWLFVAALAAAAGAVLGPRVVDGKPKREPGKARAGNEARQPPLGHPA